MIDFITYSKLRGRVLNKPFVKTLNEFILEIFEKESDFISISKKEAKYILKHLIDKNSVYKNVEDIFVDFLIDVKRNEVDIEEFGFEEEKTKELKEILKKYNEFLKKNKLADLGDIEKFVFNWISQNPKKVEVDKFEVDNIHFFSSKLQKKIFDKLEKIEIEERLENVNKNKYLIKCFDIFDEVRSALKLARELIDNGKNVKIVVSDIDEYFEIFEAIGIDYGLDVYSTKGVPLSKVKYKYPYKIKEIAKRVEIIKAKLKSFGVKVNKNELFEDLLKETILDRKFLEITETNQVFVYSNEENLIFVGANLSKFPPQRSIHAFTSKNSEKLLFKSDLYEASKTILERMKKIAKNLYVIYQENDLTKENVSILIDKGEFEELNLKFEKVKIEEIVKKEEKYFSSATHLSASKINLYNECPRRYFYRYVLNLEGIDLEEFEMDVMLKGSVMHKVFEKITNDSKNNSLKDKEVYIQETFKEFEVKDNVFTKLYKYELEKIIDSFLEYIKNISNPLTEEKFYLDENLEVIFKKEPNEYFIKGFIDRLDVNEFINIVDYKSKKVEGVDSSKIKEIKNLKDIQLGLYCFYAKKKYQKDVKASLLSFNTPDKTPIEFATLQTFNCDKKNNNIVCYNDKYEDKLKNLIFETKNNIENGEFKINEKAKCDWCEFRKICGGEK